MNVWKEYLVSHGAIWENADGTSDSLQARSNLISNQTPPKPEDAKPQYFKSDKIEDSKPPSTPDDSKQTSNSEGSKSTSSKPEDSKPSKSEETKQQKEEEMDEKKLHELESMLDSTIEDLNKFTSSTETQSKSKDSGDRDSFLSSLQKQIQNEI